MTVWDQTISLTTGRGLGGKDGGGRRGGGRLLPTADFIFFPFSHFNKGLPSFTRPLGFPPAVPLLLPLLLAGQRAPRRVSGKITLFVRVMSNFTQTAAFYMKGPNAEQSLTQSVTHWKSQSKKLLGGKHKKKDRGGLKDSHYYFQNLNIFQAAAQLSGGWRISIGNVCNLLRNQVSRWMHHFN